MAGQSRHAFSLTQLGDDDEGIDGEIEETENKNRNIEHFKQRSNGYFTTRTPTVIHKGNKNWFHKSLGPSGKGDTEDGEILEDGELTDDDESAQQYGSRATGNNGANSSSKKRDRGTKRDRKKSGRRRHESDAKRKKINYDDDEELSDENNLMPMWGTGCQESKRNKTATFSRGSKNHYSPSGLYGSTSGGSDDETFSKAIMTEGYIDASVAADEKKGIFNPKVSLGKKQKRKYPKNDMERGRKFEGSNGGPPKKKSLLDMAMSERPACKFYMEGKCAKGSLCQFNHDVEKTKKMEVCKYHLTVKGCLREKCQYMHHFPCKYYHTGAKCFSGDRCKFSHDPLTEASRKALEMRVAAEDIVNRDDPNYNSEHRQMEANSKPSLLGSPPRLRPDMKKIPSLFDIEVHPPGNSPNPSPQATSRPSGFYNETNTSSMQGPINNLGLMNSVIASNQSSQQGLLKQQDASGAGLLPTPIRLGSVSGSGVGIRPPIVGNHQGPNLQRFGIRPAAQMNNGLQLQNGNVPPVLNMLGAIIREAAMQKGSDNQNNMQTKVNMGVNSMNSKLSTGMSDVNVSDGSKTLNGIASTTGSNTGHVESKNTGFTKAESSGPNRGIGPSNTCENKDSRNILENFGSGKLTGNQDPYPNSTLRNASQDSDLETVTLNQPFSSNKSGSGQQNTQQEKGPTESDYKMQVNFGEMNEDSQDLSELDKIRKQIQAQIDEEDEEEDEEEAAPDNKKEQQNVQHQEQQLPSQKSGETHEKTDHGSSNTVLEKKVDSLDIPAHLPKTQQALFKRIQQQQLLREKEMEKREAQITVDKTSAKAVDDDWYSSDEDDEGTKPKLTDVLQKLNQQPSPQVLTPSSALGSCIASSSEQTVTSSSASTFNIMQMINAIKNQSLATKPTAETTGLSSQPSGFSLHQNSLQHERDTESSPASPPPPASTSLITSSGVLHNVSHSHPLPQTTEPPVISAVPSVPLTYLAVRISLDMPKPYVRLSDSVNAADAAFKDDPRVKWHLSFIEKQVPQVAEKKSSNEDVPQKQSDPRLVKGSADLRLTKPTDSSRCDAVRSDPRLHRTQAQNLPADPRLHRTQAQDLPADPRIHRTQVQDLPADPRLARFTNGNQDPRLHRQIIHSNQNNGDCLSMNHGMVPRHPGMVLRHPGMVLGNHGVLDNQVGGFVNGFRNKVAHMGHANNDMDGLANRQFNNFNMDGPIKPGNHGLLNGMNSVDGNMGLMGEPMNKIGRQSSQMHSVNMRSPHESSGGLESNRMITSQENNSLKEPTGHLTPFHTDPSPLRFGVQNFSDPRLRGQKILNEMHDNSNPRLRHRSTELHSNTGDSGVLRRSPHSGPGHSPVGDKFPDQRTLNHTNSLKPVAKNPMNHRDISKSFNNLQSDITSSSSQELSKASIGQEACVSKTNHKAKNDGLLSTPSCATSFVQFSNIDTNAIPKFEHRNDPRFKRVKKPAGQQKDDVEYSSPLGADRMDKSGVNDDKCQLEYNNYKHPKPGRDPRAKVIPSIQSADTPDNFNLSNSPLFHDTEAEPDLKVKHLFKSIDPTASPFC